MNEAFWLISSQPHGSGVGCSWDQKLRIDSPVPFPGSAGVLRGQEAEFNDDSSIIIRARWTLGVTYHLYIVTSDDIVTKAVGKRPLRATPETLQRQVISTRMMIYGPSPTCTV